MPYRTMTNKKKPMKFTYVERLFMSGRWYNKCFAHLILMGKPLAMVTAIVAVVGSGLGLIYGLLTGYQHLMMYLVHKHYISSDVAVGITVGIILLAFILPHIISGIRSEIRDNTNLLQRSIQDKINHGKAQTGIDSEN